MPAAHKPTRSLSARIFGPIGSAARRKVLTYFEAARPKGMVDGERLLSLDKGLLDIDPRHINLGEEGAPGDLYWIASTDAVYVTVPPNRENYGFNLRVPYEDVLEYEEQGERGYLVRILRFTQTGGDGWHEVVGRFRWPNRDLTDEIRRHLDPAICFTN